MNRFFSAHGKLLLSGEYVVLDGALALALPTRYGQHLALHTAYGQPGQLHWKSYTATNDCWFEALFEFPAGRILQSSDPTVANTLQRMLLFVQDHSPAFVSDIQAGARVTTYLDFPENWGLGSSSTLISCLSQWTGTNAYELLAASLGGSGYDIACAQAPGPILYQNKQFVHLPFRPPFHPNLYFVFLGKKQNSREGIARYREKGKAPTALLDAISRISLTLSTCSTQSCFDEALIQHEQLISHYLDLPRAQALHFPDFKGTIKSLGAWGGDFVLASSQLPPEPTRNYFSRKGYPIVLDYAQLCR